MPWSSFCTDPWSAAEELHDRGCIKRSKSYLYFHMIDQVHCLTTAAGEWAVDFIGRVDEPNEDWAEVRAGAQSLQGLGSRELLSRQVEPDEWGFKRGAVKTLPTGDCMPGAPLMCSWMKLGQVMDCSY